jgi:hypothetical protein
MPPRANRLTVKGLSDFHYKWGRLWAHAKARTMSRLIVDVFESRIEANLELIERMIREEAEMKGITFEELQESILKEGKDDDD